MGVRITDSENVSLYDSVSGWAFGPTFPSEEAALDFLEFTKDEPDPRVWDNHKTEMWHALWIAERGKEFGLELGYPR